MTAPSTIAKESELPRTGKLYIPLYHETPEAAAARVEKQTGKPVTVYRLGTLTFIAVEEGAWA